MVVSDVMSTAVDYVTTNTSVRDIARLIFGKGINGVPVLDKTKLVGFITERDILAKFYPSVEEYMEDPVNTSDFISMEKKVSNILSLSAGKIMSRNPVTVTADTPILKAQSLMFINKIGRLPVVDSKNHWVGIISKGDIFRSVVGDQIPSSAEEEYHDWVSRHYDLVTGWEERLGNEIPDLVKLFNKIGAKNIVDIGCGTGEHDIALAKKGFKVLGLEKSPLMFSKANSKLSKLGKSELKNLRFENGNYIELLEKEKNPFDAALFMGNAFTHLVDDHKEVLKVVSSKLSKNGIAFFQINNFYRLFNVRKRFLSLNFSKSKSGVGQDFAFLEFYDPPRKSNKNLTLNMAVFESGGNNWRLRSMNSTSILELDKSKMEALLRSAGFKTIDFYGADANGSLFKELNKNESYYLNVLAKK